MSRQVVWTPRALRDARRLGSEVAQRVGRALDRYVETGYGDVKPVIGSEDEQRLKVGKVRLFFVERDNILEVVGVLPRDKAYRARELPAPFGTAEATVRALTFGEDEISVALSDARTISVPLAWYPRLLDGTPEQRENWELIGDGDGIHWPDIDEDLSVRGFLRGARAPGAKA